MTLVYKAHDYANRGRRYQRAFAAVDPDLEVVLWPEMTDPQALRYLLVWQPPADLGTAFPNLEVIFSIGAGADQIDLTTIPAHVPVVRMVEPGIQACMAEYCSMAVLALHRGLPTLIDQQKRQVWDQVEVITAAERRVGILGAGTLGEAVLSRLGAFGFPLSAWTRQRRDYPGVTCYAGPEELDRFLAGCDILICLLPLTPETEGMLDAAFFARLPKGAMLVQAGRGPQMKAADLIDALDSGQLSAAVVDVTDPEPLPQGHPLWSHPKVILTPHNASMTQPESAARAVVENIRRHEAGEPMIGVVDRARGY